MCSIQWEKSTIAKDNLWANSVESKQRVLPACQWFGNACVQSFRFISAKKLPKLREDHREMVKISRRCGCQWQVCNGYWEQDLGQEIRLCRINEEEHPMEDQWAKFGLFVISVRKLAQVLVFCGSSIVSDFGSDHVFQLLALTAGLVSQLNFDTCSCLLPSFLGPLWDMACLLLHRLCS